METWSLPKARPISCNDCPTFQRLHMSVRWFAESFTRFRNGINTTFREKIYTRWCCIDRLSWLGLSECGPSRPGGKSHIPISGLLRHWDCGNSLHVIFPQQPKTRDGNSPAKPTEGISCSHGELAC